jgi:hypothetical protein
MRLDRSTPVSATRSRPTPTTSTRRAASASSCTLHARLSRRGRSRPGPARHARVLSYGLTPGWEAGLYVPVSRDSAGNTTLTGAKLRLKWLPIRTDEHGGWFLGVNTELSRLKRRLSESRNSFELGGSVARTARADESMAYNPAAGEMTARCVAAVQRVREKPGCISIAMDDGDDGITVGRAGPAASRSPTSPRRRARSRHARLRRSHEPGAGNCVGGVLRAGVGAVAIVTGADDQRRRTDRSQGSRR